MKLSRRKIRSGAPAFLAGALVATCLVGGVAVASIPATNTGNVTSCVNKTTHAVRIIDYQAGARCAGTESTISWSKGWRARGAWHTGVAYAVGDIVTYNGSTFVSKAPSTNATPSASSTFWTVLVTKPVLDTTLPSGKTLRGEYMLYRANATAGEFVEDGLSFGFTLSSAPTWEAGPSAHCTGTAGVPTAAPGYLCTYSTGSTNTSGVTVFDPKAFGGRVAASASGAGFMYAGGTWAVTAP